MDTLRKKAMDGEINSEIYQKAAMKAAIEILTLDQYDYIGQIGNGSFGSVIEMKVKNKKKTVAAKLVLKDYIYENELNIWPTLHHENILPLISCELIESAHTYAFITPICETTLFMYLQQHSFCMQEDALDLTVKWLKDVVSGLNYLHGRGICHLDIKTDNVLLSKYGTAMVCDFGFASSAETLVSNYGSPFVYRPPEGYRDANGSFPRLDGQKFDVWTLGTLALEMFSGHALGLSFSYRPQPKSWTQEVYPVIFHILKGMEWLMHVAFVRSNDISERTGFVVSFVTSCLNVSPEMRPTITEIRDYPLFSAHTEKSRAAETNKSPDAEHRPCDELPHEKTNEVIENTCVKDSGPTEFAGEKKVSRAKRLKGWFAKKVNAIRRRLTRAGPKTSHKAEAPSGASCK